MYRLVFVAVPIVLIGCAQAHTKQISPQLAQTKAPACDVAGSPVIVVDGVVQRSSCAAPKTEEAQSCDSKAPLYVIDGVRTCGKP